MSRAANTAPRAAFWRNTEVRAVFYQIVVLALVLLAGYTIFLNTQENLRERGIASGFGFLEKEAGFGIGEHLPVPQLDPELLAFFGVLAGGLILSWLLSKWAAHNGRTVGESTPMVTAVLVLVIILPVAVLTVFGENIHSVVYDESKSYGIALWTGILNTIKVSSLGCVLATLLGLIIGIARLSSNWLVRKLASTYVEVLRNLPLLLQIYFWYFAVIRSLPNVRQSFTVGDFFVLNNRGVYLPDPTWQASTGYFFLAIGIALVGIFYWKRYVDQYRDATGEQLPVLLPALGAVVVLPALVWLVGGQPYQLIYPELRGFNYQGGLVLSPEYASMLAALVLYTASYIAEIVRSGIEAISKGQREAAGSLGLHGTLVMRLVILPQALRVIIPPLTSQYLNLTKNSSLGVAIAFPELVSVGGTILNQSGQAIEIIGITMLVYLTFSLLISLFMNWYNERVKLVER